MAAMVDMLQLQEGWQRGKSQSESTLCLLRAGRYADVWFRCKGQDKDDESDRIASHKLILASRSPVFEEMFYRQTSEPVHEIDLPEIEKIPFLLFLRFLYSDTTELTEEHAFSVMRIAHEYQVTACKEFCSRYLQEALCSENVCAIRESTLHYADEMLSKSIMNFIDDNAACVIKSKGFMEVDKDSLEYILKGNTFFAPELDIIEAVDRWAEHYLTKRGIMVDALNKRQAMGKAFYYLRLPTLSPKDFLTAQFKYTYLSLLEQTNVSRFIIEKADIDLCNSREERLPRKDECFMPFSEPGAREIPKNSPIESHAILKCSKAIDLVEVFLVKVSKETEVTCTIMSSFGVEKAKIEIKLLPSENPSIKFNPPVTLDAPGPPFKLIIKTAPLDTEVSAEQSKAKDQVVVGSSNLEQTSSGVSLTSALATPLVFGSTNTAKTDFGATQTSSPALPFLTPEDESIFTPTTEFRQKLKPVITKFQPMRIKTHDATQTGNYEMESGQLIEHVTLQSGNRIFQFVRGIRYVNQSGRN